MSYSFNAFKNLLTKKNLIKIYGCGIFSYVTILNVSVAKDALIDYDESCSSFDVKRSKSRATEQMARQVVNKFPEMVILSCVWPMCLTLDIVVLSVYKYHELFIQKPTEKEKESRDKELEDLDILETVHTEIE